MTNDRDRIEIIRPPAPTIDQVAEAVSWHHQCNIWCDGYDHAEVVWLHVEPDLTMDEQDIASLIAIHALRTFAALYLWHRPAPEARSPSDAERVVTGATVEDAGDDARLVGVERMPDNTTIPAEMSSAAYLVGFRSGIKFDVVRRMWATEKAKIDARAREKGSRP